MSDQLSEIFNAYGSCDRLTAADRSKFSAMGVFGPSLDWRDDGRQFEVKSARVTFTQDGIGPWFDFDREKGTRVPIIVCRDERGEIADLAAWRPLDDHVALWRGAVCMVGESACMEPRIGDGKLWIREGVLDWLRHDRTGVVMVQPERARPLLTAASPVAVKSPEHRERLLALWRPPAIQVFDIGQAQATLEAVA